MGGHVTTDQTTQLVFTQDEETWIVDPSVSIAVDGDDAVFSSEANSTLINKGQISASGVGSAGVVFFGDGGVIRNSGEILSAAGRAIAIFSTGGETTVVKNLKGGVIEGGISAGPTYETALVGDNGNETVVNAGTIGRFAISGLPTAVDLGAGDDTFTNFQKIGKKIVSGTVLGLIELGDGNDTLLGGKKQEFVRDGAGSDTYKLGGGDDAYFAKHTGLDGNDVISGGRGVDGFLCGDVTTSVFINFDSKDHPVNGTAIVVTANTAQGDDISGSFVDKITGFENASGSQSDDIIFGSKAANTVTAGGGSDRLYGLAGNDILAGGSGADTLVGGKGADALEGNLAGFPPDLAADSFLFMSLKDSTPGPDGRDVIRDFEDTRDIINLVSIDANTSNAAGTNDAFSFLGVDAAFSSAPGGLRVITKDFGWLVQAEVNGDKKADFAIQVNDPTHSISWTAGDFAL